MFAAKSDVSAFSDAELLRMDSKEYTSAARNCASRCWKPPRPQTVLDRKDSLMAAMEDVAQEDGADQVLLFVVDILREEATLLVPNDLVKTGRREKLRRDRQWRYGRPARRDEPQEADHPASRSDPP
jgi:manganese-dependent inorganic pyrophosphatase